MAYSIVITPSAKSALESCISVYGQADEIRAWIKSIAELTSRGIEAGSLEVKEILEDILGGEGALKRRNWEISWEFLKSAGIAEKARGLYIIVTSRQPPVQLHTRMEEFFFLGAFTSKITAIYEVNHVSKQIIIRTFDGLPGQ